MSDSPGNERQSGPDSVAALRDRLERSRAALLETLATLTESDFASEIEEGRSVLDLLAELAPAELAASTDAGAAAPAPRRRGAQRPPPMGHDLAGARRRTLRALDAIEEGGSAESEAPPELRAVAEREEQAAAAIRARFGESSEGA